MSLSAQPDIGGSKFCSLKVQNLKCESLNDPLAIDILSPQLSWQLISDIRNQKQLAWQVLVSDKESELAQNRGSFWDSGKILSGQTFNVPYRGKALPTVLKLFWKVRVWDTSGAVSAWSRIASWEMGYLKSADWKAKWIGKGEDQYPDSALTGPAPYLRKTFRTAGEIRSARIRVSGLGFYELYLNGEKVGDQVLAPAQTNYDTRKLQKLIYFHDDQSRQRVLYNTFDVTRLLRSGNNAIGMILGNGWYNQRDRTVEGCMWYSTPRLILQLEITYQDGRKQLICSDKTWKLTTGPIIHDGIFTGELYDARLELGDWNSVSYSDQNWQNALEVKAPAGRLESQLAPFDKVVRTIRPVFLSKDSRGTYLFDAGEMISGWVQLRMHGQKGDTVRIRHIEELGGDYHQVDTYILKGGENESYEPRFTWHAFRQIEISGLKYSPEAKDLLVKVVHTDVVPTGSFECSNPLFNKIFENYGRTQLANLHGSISSDCPHRERLGYTGDGQVAIESAILSFDMTRFYQKWFLDMEDARNHHSGYVPHTVPFGGGGGGPAWGSAYVIMPWFYYQYYGDKKVLQLHYDGMKQWVGYLGTRCDQAGIVVREEPKGWCLGDWATPEKIKLSPELVNTCYYFYVADLMAKIAGVLGNPKDIEYFTALAAAIKTNFNNKFYQAAIGQYSDGKQGANLFPMAFGMTEEKERPRVFANILRHLEETGNHFDTGILATPLLLKVLTDGGRADLAYTVMNQRDFPGFGDYIIGKNATTIWENWNGKSSHSHPMYGSVVAWFFNTLAGISPDPEHPGKADFMINPFIDNELTFAKASYNSVYGLLSSSWKKERDALILDVEIPVNTTATISFPCGKPEQVEENGVSVMKSGEFKFLRIEKDRLLFRVGSGKYHFMVVK
ncbi:MAG TPA: family 78 glycoside hydrolase catalytic domain [Prolixibacteraceae bacterium]